MKGKHMQTELHIQGWFSSGQCTKFRAARLAERAFRKSQTSRRSAIIWEATRRANYLAKRAAIDMVKAICPDLQDATVDVVGVLGFGVRGWVELKGRRYHVVASVSASHDEDAGVAVWRQAAASRPMKVNNFALPQPVGNAKRIA